MKVVCLMCGRARLVTVCGDQSCACTRRPGERGAAEAVLVPGMVFSIGGGYSVMACDWGREIVVRDADAKVIRWWEVQRG